SGQRIRLPIHTAPASTAPDTEKPAQLPQLSPSAWIQSRPPARASRRAAGHALHCGRIRPCPENARKIPSPIPHRMRRQETKIRQHRRLQSLPVSETCPGSILLCDPRLLWADRQARATATKLLRQIDERAAVPAADV